MAGHGEFEEHERLDHFSVEMEAFLGDIEQHERSDNHTVCCSLFFEDEAKSDYFGWEFPGRWKGTIMASTTKRGSAKPVEKLESRIPALMADLTSPDAAVRMKARKALIVIGKPIVPSLIQLLSHRKTHFRWEAAKALGEIADPLAAFALVNALEDRDNDVRWLAAEGVAALGQEGLTPLLAALLERSKSCSICEGAHHICVTLAKKRKLGPILRPLVSALQEPEPELAVPSAAYAALSKLRELSGD
jgi:HEAT repeat protein